MNDRIDQPARKPIRCPTCGHIVPCVFHHVAIDCEADMTEAQIRMLIKDAEDQERMEASCGR